MLRPKGVGVSSQGCRTSPRIQVRMSHGDRPPPLTPLMEEEINQISESAAQQMIRDMRCFRVSVSREIHEDGFIQVCAVKKTPEDVEETAETRRRGRRVQNPILLLHGFDSSLLDFRRLVSALAERGAEVYAVDLLGWGLTQTEGVKSLSPHAKREVLKAFQMEIAGERPMHIFGSSLGGTATIDFSSEHPEAVASLILAAPQGFVDGLGLLTMAPKFLKRLGISILKSWWLREFACKLSYFDKDRCATEDAVRLGRLHTLREGWEDAQILFQESGGYSVSSKLQMVRDLRSLVLWGEGDEILPPKENAQKLTDAIEADRLVMVEKCGHVPHLERPELTADLIVDWALECEEKEGRGNTERGGSGRTELQNVTMN